MTIYPDFNYYPSKFRLGNKIIIQGEINTNIRKKFNGIYYLCKLVLRYEQPISVLKQQGVPRKSYNNWIMNLLLQELMRHSYRMLKFSKLTPELTDLNGNSIGFQVDNDQRTELERLKL